MVSPSMEKGAPPALGAGMPMLAAMVAANCVMEIALFKRFPTFVSKFGLHMNLFHFNQIVLKRLPCLC